MVLYVKQEALQEILPHVKDDSGAPSTGMVPWGSYPRGNPVLLFPGTEAQPGVPEL